MAGLRHQPRRDANTGQIYARAARRHGLRRLTDGPCPGCSRASAPTASTSSSTSMSRATGSSSAISRSVRGYDLSPDRARLTANAASLPPKAMSDDTPESLIPYDEIVQEALRDVVGRVLGEVERSGGLPGGHHFYITFKTRLPGVAIPKHLVGALPGRDDDRHPAPLLGPEGRGRRLSGRPVVRRRAVDPARAVRRGHPVPRPGGRILADFPGQCRGRAHEEHEEAENDAPVRASRPTTGRTSSSVDFTRKK